MNENGSITSILERLDALERHQQAKQGIWVIQGVLRALAGIVMLLVAAIGPSVGIVIPKESNEIILLVLAWYFGSEAALKYHQTRNHN